MTSRPVVFQLCPSVGKPCGIYRYSLYIKQALESQGYICSIYASCLQLHLALASQSIKPIILVQHEYGLYDLMSHKLSGPDTTSSVISWLRSALRDSIILNSAIIMHTLVRGDPFYDLLNKQLFSSCIPIFHLNKSGSLKHRIDYLDHGVPILENSPLTARLSSVGCRYSVVNRTVAAFGMLTPNKLPINILEICRLSGWKLLACFATIDQSSQFSLRAAADRLGVIYNISFDFLEESELLHFLSPADIAISLQSRNRHFSTSGSIRLLMNLGIPVLCNYCSQFDDVKDGTIRTTSDHAPALLDSLFNDPDIYHYQTLRLLRYANAYSIQRIYSELVARLSLPLSNSTINLDCLSCLNLPDSSRANLFSPLASLPASVIIPSRISHIDLCLAMTFTGQQRIIYVNESLQLAADESEPLASSDNVSDDHLLMQSIYIFILARMKAALITWGLAEDIFALSDRRLSLYDCLCSGDRHYISRVIISAVDEKASEYSDLYDAILNWRPEICAPGVIANLLQQYPSNFEDIILPPDLRLFFNRSKLVSTRIRNFFHLNSSLYLSNSDLLLNSTCMRLQSFSQPSVAREN